MEALGVALGAFPILIELVRYYKAPLKEFKEHPESLKNYRFEIQLQQERLRCIVGQVLGPNPTDDELLEYLQREHPQAAEAYMHFISRMGMITSEILKQMEVDPAESKDPKFAAKVRRGWRRVKYSFDAKERERTKADLIRIIDMIDDLRKVPAQNNRDPEVQLTASRFNPSQCNSARASFKSLHRALGSEFSCDCSISHRAAIDLDWETDENAAAEAFNLMVSYAKGPQKKLDSWRETKIRIVDPSEPVNSSPKAPAKLCQKLSSSLDSSAPSDNLQDPEDEHRQFILNWSPGNPREIQEAVPLKQVISLQQPFDPRNSYHLTLKQRLGVAASLAWAVLHLGGSRWLNDQWADEQAQIFYENNPESDVAVPSQHPYVSYIFPTPSPEEPVGEGVPQSIPRRTVYAVGVLLIELSIERPISEELQQGSWFEIHESVLNFLQQIEDTGFAPCRRAAERCIKLSFEVSVRSRSFNNQDFQKEFFYTVFEPIKDTYLRFPC
ncbi:uncharacterized protein LDX57_007406 [Aspergillus melleus]|uniref:uncharacterized protein n=1 Tax=Aspergillus melleus TaxID=138277 RepID=UPI001E8CA345|nr:uncharacterized protein LDX57_007406 [Aspergillus melleus]KAH8429734.1 hypothetical protein LDX57_007406 [Aspergillus melleus]